VLVPHRNIDMLEDERCVPLRDIVEERPISSGCAVCSAIHQNDDGPMLIVLPDRMQQYLEA
jgi:hypothetical protein